jgi:hypothetical protein
VPVRQAAHLQRRLTGPRAGRRRDPPWLHRRPGGPLAQHGGHDAAFARVGGARGVHVAAVAQHGHTVADLLDLQEAVGDEQHRAALGPGVADRLEHAVRVVGGQRGGDLVQQQQSGVVGQHPRQVQHAKQRQRQHAGHLAELHAAGSELVEPAPEGGRVGAGEAEVLRDGQVGDEGRVLEDRGQAAGPGVAG